MALFIPLGLPFAGCGTGPTEGPSSRNRRSPPRATARGSASRRVSRPLTSRSSSGKKSSRRPTTSAPSPCRRPTWNCRWTRPTCRTSTPKAFDKRVADHKAIINRILAKNLPALAEKYKISVADIEKIEDEANKLRWLPPADPVFKPKEPDADSKQGAGKKAETEPGDAKSP